MRRQLLDLLRSQPLDNSLLLGFYGGGNYGDELLMEVLAGMLEQQGTQDITIAYQQPELYSKFHHNFGYACVDIHSKSALIKTILAKKHIIVGGGGLWGMDTNRNIFLMSLLLLLARRLLGKKVYLLNVGYYDSAPALGRAGAWLAAKAANIILARDPESYTNFKALHPNTLLDTDIAWYIDTLNLESYQPDLASLEKEVQVTDKTLFITLRRFNDAQQERLTALVETCLAKNDDKRIIIALMEPRHVDPAGYRQLRTWQRQFPNIQIIDYGFNPLALFLFFRKYRDQLIFIGPQFHGILSAHLNGMPYLPLAYDNKVHNLLKNIAPKTRPIALRSLRLLDLQRFIDKTYGGTA